MNRGARPLFAALAVAAATSATSATAAPPSVTVAEQGVFEKRVVEEDFTVDFGMPKDEERKLRETFRERTTRSMEAKGMEVSFHEDYPRNGSYRVRRTEYVLVQAGDRVPAKVGTLFGLRLSVAGSTREPVTYRIEPPPEAADVRERLGEGATWAGELLPGEASSLGAWEIDAPWQEVKGTWKLRVLHDGKTLLARTFVLE